MSDGHQWCYQGDLLLEEVSKHRQEWCAKCGTTRVNFHRGWAIQVPDNAKANPCEGKDTFLSSPPERTYTTRAGKVVLGRGLKDLMEKNPLSKGGRGMAALFSPPTKKTR